VCVKKQLYMGHTHTPQSDTTLRRKHTRSIYPELLIYHHEIPLTHTHCLIWDSFRLAAEMHECVLMRLIMRVSHEESH